VSAPEETPIAYDAAVSMCCDTWRSRRLQKRTRAREDTQTPN
jgi:hypothetical protein